MTKIQESYHWKLWTKVHAHCWWWDEKGRVMGDGSALGLFAGRVWDRAKALAKTNLRAMVAADLRHALYLLACGKESLKDLNSTSDFTRVKGWMLLCIDDASIEGAELAGMTDASGAQDRRRRVVWAIRNSGFPQSYIDAVATDCFGSHYRAPFFEDLEEKDLDRLHKLLRQRRVPVTEKNPF